LDTGCIDVVVVICAGMCLRCSLVALVKLLSSVRVRTVPDQCSLDFPSVVVVVIAVRMV
jgi:hypothetical protein